ncbi:MAG: peptide ABC transporter substrate-binding protein [Bdellovibrionales bacterium]
MPWIPLLFSLAMAAETLPFSFHLFSEPHNLDPQMTHSASGNYLFYNIYRGLYRFDSDRGLIPDGADKCELSGLNLTCKLRSRKWSNGAPITADDYVKSFQRLINPKLSSPQADVLFSLKNARSIWSGKLKPESLGAKAVDASTLRLELEFSDQEILFRLIHPALSPLPPGGFLPKESAAEQVTSGVYQIKEWRSGHQIQLRPNNGYDDRKDRPNLVVYFLDNDSTALRLYELGKMTFLRRVTAGEIPRLRSKKEFHQVPMARFDYVGFGPSLVKYPNLRAALVRAVDFKLFLKLFDTRSPPGCPSFPPQFMDKGFCLKPDLDKAKSLAKDTKWPERLEFQYSLMGGDDIARAAEWFQGQWKKNLGHSVELRSQEQGVYLRTLKADPPDIFRKGVSLDRPTCLAALEIFTKGQSENYIRLDDSRYDQLVQQLAEATPKDRPRKCREATEYLFNTNRLIPLGEMHFSVMAKPGFVGWRLNSLNQLDLTDLRRTGQK